MTVYCNNPQESFKYHRNCALIDEQGTVTIVAITVASCDKIKFSFKVGFKIILNNNTN
jgi:hypothetical protein